MPGEELAVADGDAVSSFRDRERCLRGREATAAVEMAEPTNWRREIPDTFVMLTSQKSCEFTRETLTGPEEQAAQSLQERWMGM